MEGCLEQNDMKDLPEDLDGFLDVYEARRGRMRERLISVLGREPGSLIEAGPATESGEPVLPDSTPRVIARTPSLQSMSASVSASSVRWRHLGSADGLGEPLGCAKCHRRSATVS